MKGNNIIIGVLVAVIAIMGVAFAAFSTTLKINGSATIDSTWDVRVTGWTCKNTTQKDSGKASTCTADMSGNVVTATMGFASPGDVITLTVDARNLGTLNANASMFAKMHLTTNASSNCTNVTTQGYVTSYDTGSAVNGTNTTITYSGQTLGPVTILKMEGSDAKNLAQYTFTFTYNAGATGNVGNCTFTGTLNATQTS